MNRSLCMMLATLVVVTFAVYWPVRHFGLVDYDDITYLVDNPFVKNGLTLDAVRDAFAHPRFSNYAPLVSISYYLDQNLFALNPHSMHLENVVLHLLCGLLIWRLVFVLTGRLQRGFMVSALFLCHPMHVESVAWLSERKDVLSTAWLLGSMLVYIAFTRRQTGATRAITYAGMLILYTLSLLTKSMGVTLPVVLLLLDLWPLCRGSNRSIFQLLVEKIPLFLLAGVFAWLAENAQRSSGSITSLIQLDLGSRVINALVCYVIYLAKLIVPVNLAVFYPHPLTRPVGAAIAAGGLLLLITIAFYRMRVRKPYLAIGWLWFLITLLPVIGILQIGAQAMADRYSYFPSIGLFIAATWSICELVKMDSVLKMGSMLIVSIYAAVAHRQVTYWADTQALFTHALQVTEDNYLAHEELAADAYAHHDLPGAFQQYQLAIKNWQDPRGYHGLGNCWLGIDDSLAIYNYQRAVDLLPKSVNYHTDLAYALRRNGRLDEAKAQAEMAVTINPAYAPAQAELANISALLHIKP